MSGEHPLALALALARGDEHRTSPNPTVGCVLVDPGGSVVGSGRTEPAGGRHAEVVALAEAGPRAAGATAWVTLEPCDHTGRTGPCSVALRDAGVARVVLTRRDPVETHTGGVETLRAADVAAELVRDDGWSAASTPRFLRRARTGSPWVTLKVAHGPDGGTVPSGGRWITGRRARRRVHAQRARHDAVLVGVGTVLADDPRLDVRHVSPDGPQPRPVVVDSDARTPSDAAVVRRGALVVVGTGAPHERVARLLDGGAEVAVVARDAAGRTRLHAALAACAERGMHDVYAEPGDTLGRALVEAGLIGELVLHHPAGAVTSRPAAWRAGAWHAVGGTTLGDDVEERWRPLRSVDATVSAIRRWATATPTVRGVVLVTAPDPATGPGTPVVGLVALVDDPEPWVTDDGWLHLLGDPIGVEDDHDGTVATRRVRLLDGSRVDVGLVTPEWAALPLSSPAARSLRGPVRVLHDPIGLLRRAVASVR